jgi:hypothetical protein
MAPGNFDLAVVEACETMAAMELIGLLRMPE